MAIKQLSPEEVKSMSLAEKDAWWLANVYRGDMPQLTVRSALTGVLLGGLLSLTNLYVGARTGWSLGVGITSVILSFALFKALSRLRLGRDMTVLENNAMQSIATSAGYQVGPLFTSLAAYTMITGTILPMGRVIVWLYVISLLGVLFAFPMKKRFINDEQLPFPDGKAAGVVMDALHESDEKEGLLKAKLLLGAGLLSAALEFIRDKKMIRFLFGLKSIPEYWDELLYDGVLGDWLKERNLTPSLLGTQLRELSIRWDTSIILMATGGLSGIRNGVSILIGAVLNYVILAPYLIRAGVILPKDGHYGFRQITVWALWGGVACMTTSSLYSFFSKPKLIIDPLRAFFQRRKAAPAVDKLAHIELPLWISAAFVPVVGAVVVVMAHAWFDVSYLMGAVAVPLVFVFALIAVNSTAITSITPTGALGKLTQLTFGVLAPKNIVTNVMTAGITAEVASNAGNLLMDIKPGYMLGAKPRHQAIGHVLGAAAGIALAVPVWYYVFIEGDPSRYGSEKLPVPSAVAWKGVADVLKNGLGNLHPTARSAVIVGALVGIVVEVSKQVTKGKFPLSAVGLGLAFVLAFQDCWSIFLGSLIFWVFQRRAGRFEKAQKEVEAKGGEAGVELEVKAPRKKPWPALFGQNTEAICAGIIAGGALMGIAVKVINVVAVPDVAKVKPSGALIKPVIAKVKAGP
jgi:uncharacterized oligopeptide transporter (OPT) family protein